MPVYLGLDCGGSSSRALALDESGGTLFAQHAGPANLVSTPLARLRKNISAVLQGAPNPDYVCGCFAGLIGADTRTLAMELLAASFPSARLRVEPDYAAAYWAFSEPQDICVIAGTGSLVCSYQEGKMAKSGGRGYLLGDEGASYRYGRDAVNAYLDDPASASTALRSCVRDVYETEDPVEIIQRTYGTGTPALTLGKMAKAVAQDARIGVPYALRSVCANAEDLAVIVQKHAERWFAESRSLKVGLAGGLWKSSILFREEMARALEKALSDKIVTVTPIQRPPVFGAVALAKELEIGN